MGHRAHVAYEQDDGTYELHYSHWGAFDLELEDKISKETPLGGEPNEPEFMNELLSALTNSEDDIKAVGGRMTESQRDTAVDAEVMETLETEEEVIDAASSITIEAVYFVDTEFNCKGFPVFGEDSQGKAKILEELREWQGEESD